MPSDAAAVGTAVLETMFDTDINQQGSSLDTSEPPAKRATFYEGVVKDARDACNVPLDVVDDMSASAKC